MIETREEYEYCKERGYEPLRDARFPMSHELRLELQREFFGRGNNEENNLRFYKRAWEVAEPKVCENCGRPLYKYASWSVSHILSRGAHPELAYDLRNFNLLCYSCHCAWELPTTRKEMTIYNKNEKTIKLLKDEYGIK